MKEADEPEIKLFGRKIVLPENGGTVASGDCSGESVSGSGGGDDCNRCLESSIGREGEADDEKDHCLESRGGREGEIDDEKELHAQENKEADECAAVMLGDDENPDVAEEPPNPTASPELEGSSKTAVADEDAVSENEQTDGTKTAVLKKPDKIIPCPRCNSMDTKFCYFNNYNVNQPRHFCKSCQRYWTAGGTMRNVPVGAGRRKNKNSASHCRHISISEVLQAAKVDVPNGFRHPIMSFGHDSSLCESMSSVMNLSEKRAANGYCQKGDIRDDCSSINVATTSSTALEGGRNGPQQAMMPNLNGVPYPITCIPGVAWPLPWNPAMPLPAMCPPGYPVPVYPTPYWNCGAPGAWNVPWVSAPSPATNEKAKGCGSGPNSPLGKHMRNGELKPSDSEGVENSILVPKTLRIDDPEEAAKSSIWETLGIKYDSISREGLFKALQPKGDAKKVMVPASPALQANPAALSRSINFQEGA